MKRNNIFVFMSTGLLSISFGTLAFISFNNHETDKASAYSSSVLPTTIDLNDTGEADIRSYYSSLNSLSQSERQGTNLLKNLKEILKNGQKYYSYDDGYGTPIWQMYEIIDRDWEKSPASSTTYGYYDSVNNRLVDYEYGTSNSNRKNDPYVHALYVNRNVDNQSKVWGDHSQEGWGINREHVWAKSHGMKDVETSDPTAGARGDPMHLMAGNGYINGKDFHYHSAYFFGFVDLTKEHRSVDNDGSEYTYLSGNYEGTSLNRGFSRTVFEPQDSDKGDIARAIFYMAARYNFYSGSDEDGIDSNNPNLVITDAEYDTNGNGSYVCSESNPGQMGIIRDLLVWNRLDPPDEWEIHRNNLVYSNYTNNRNPFIDYPEWAEYIWGQSTTYNDNRMIKDYNSNPTGYASPSSDLINNFQGVVSVTGIEVTPTETTLSVGDTLQLEWTVSPSNATNKNVYFWTTDNSVATVSDAGFVTAVGAGEVWIGVGTVDGDFTQQCYINISQAIPESDYYLTTGSPYINGVPYKMYFNHTIEENLGNYYFIGGLSNTYYGSSSTNASQAVDVYFEMHGIGQNIYYFDQNNGGAKTYLYVYRSGGYSDFGLIESAPSNPWIYTKIDDSRSCLTYTVDGYVCTLGSYNKYTNFAAVNTGGSQYDFFDFISSNKESDDALKVATGMATVFKDSVVCDGSGATAPTFVSDVTWSTFEFVYSKLDTDARNLLKTTASSQAGSDLEKGLAKYDYILQKYNTSSTTPYNDFLGRIESNMISLTMKSSFNYSDSSMIVVLICAISICVTLCGVTIIKKKKIVS